MSDTAASPVKKSVGILIMTVLVPFGIGYYMSYLFRTVNAIISPQLVADVGLTPGDLGLMTSAYFITFAVVQLPLGIILDRFGPRKVQAALLIVAAMGASLFAFGNDAITLALGRGLIGIGVSGCLMAALKANVLWFPKEKIPLVNGIIFAFGTFGALSTTVPLEILIQTVDWRTVFWWLSGISVLSAVLIYALVPEKTHAARAPVAGQTAFSAQISDLKQVYGSAFFWRLSFMVFLHNGVFLSYQALWAAPWLRDVAGLDRSGVAEAMLMFNVGMFCGVLSIGLLATRLQRLGIPTIVPAVVGIVVSIIIQVMFASAWTAYPAILCLVWGYFGSSSTLAYAVLNQHFPQNLTGRVNTAQNMLTFIAAFAVQWIAGVIIGSYAAPKEGLYSADGHQTALIVFICIEIAGLLYFLWPRRRGDGMP
ncbi:MAG: putative MFS family arabinose efflux permease [Paracoccaceae bacterium]|jgi:predicted MFS family arabinose efflux permease